jgi:hypothetical protein
MLGRKGAGTIEVEKVQSVLWGNANGKAARRLHAGRNEGKAQPGQCTYRYYYDRY